MTLGPLFRVIAAGSVTRARVAGFGLIAAVEVIIALVMRSVALSDRTEAAALFLDFLGLRIVIPIAALVFGTATLGDPIEDGTYVYLWLRPSPRWQITVGAYLATLSAVLPLVALPTVVATLIVHATPELAVGAIGSVLIASLAYSAVFVLLGHLTQRGLIWGIAYLLIVEQFISLGGTGLGFVTVHSHAVSFLARTLDIRLPVDYFGLPMSVLSPMLFTMLFLAISVRRQRTMSVA